jgi:hypothetical protein
VSFTANGGVEKGTFGFDDDGKFAKNPPSQKLFWEDITVAINTDGKWREMTQSYVSASNLYAWDDVAGDTRAYVISALAPRISRRTR